MSRVSRELAVIPRTGWLITSLLVGGIALAILVFPDDPPLPERFFIAALVLSALFVYGLLVSYVYADAKRREMRAVLWTLVAAFVPNALGFIVYFLLREPLPQPCKQCGTPARREFAFCPSCGAMHNRACPSCHNPVEPVWTHCAHCGSLLNRRPEEDAGKMAAPHEGQEEKT